jgi:hypothetical protein
MSIAIAMLRRQSRSIGWSANVARRVAIVVDPELGGRVAELRATSPAWVVSSPANLAAWGRSASLEPNSAIFKATNTEARRDNLFAQLDDVELHFGADSYPENPYVGIHVIGLKLTKEIEADLARHGFGRFREMVDGFEADLAERKARDSAVKHLLNGV